MPLHKRLVLPLAATLAVAASCASAQRPADQADEQARRDLGEARDAQQKAAEQEKNVAAARQEVVKAQQQLAAAQRRESDEQAKLQQLQQQANQRAQQARAVAPAGAPAPGVAGSALPQSAQIISGHVLQARPNQLVLQARNGQTLTLDVNDQTRVVIGGEQRSASELQQGADARVSYENTTGRPTAVMVEVPRAAGAPARATGAAIPPPAPGYPATPAPGSEAMPVPGANTPPAGTQ